MYYICKPTIPNGDSDFVSNNNMDVIIDYSSINYEIFCVYTNIEIILLIIHNLISCINLFNMGQINKC